MRIDLVRRSWASPRTVVLGLLVGLLGALSLPRSYAQSPVEISGLAYFDYSYVFDSFDEDEVGANTFDYRRIYLTTDYTLSDAFSGRIRLEAQGTSTTAQGRPAPFIKDAYLTWSDPIGEGTRLRMGVQSPPLFEVSERVWGYRSLDKTILDRVKANDSRDMGLRGDVHLAPGGAVRLAAMVANGNGVRPEDGDEQGKHVYGQVQFFPGEILQATAGADYKVYDGVDDTREGVTKVTAFVGAVTDRYRGGVEGFYLYTTFDETSAPTEEGFGLSVFGAVNLSDQTSIVARYDFVDDNAGRSGVNENYGLVAFVYRPNPRVELMPNLVVEGFEGSDSVLTGRFTVHVRF